MNGEIDSSIIVESIKKGNIEVLLQWIDKNKQKLYRMAWSYLENKSDVEDVFHNSIIKVVENISSLKNVLAFEGWFLSILLNECRKILRERRKVQPLEFVEINDSSAYSTETQVENLDLIGGLKSINEEYRELILLKYYSGYSQKEIAEILNIPLGTVKTKIFRGLKILRNIMRREA